MSQNNVSSSENNWDPKNITGSENNIGHDNIAGSENITGYNSIPDSESNASLENIISLENISYTIDGTETLRDISLKCKKGHILGILGPNGAGKSTLLDIISGLKNPAQGQLEIKGMKYEDNGQKIHQILGMVHEKPILYQDLTGSEHLEFMGALYQIKRDKLREKIDTLTSFFELEDFVHRPISTYPKGIRQKISLAAGIIHEPQILILDEPTSSLDPRSARAIKLLVQDYKNKGNTIILSTHILEIAESLCDDILILQKGNIISYGEMPKLKADKRLEDIFLDLTGGADYAQLIKYLQKD